MVGVPPILPALVVATSAIIAGWALIAWPALPVPTTPAATTQRSAGRIDRVRRHAPTLSWHELMSSAVDFPREPALLHDSPMQLWWHSNKSWDVASVKSLLTSTSAGDYKVRLQWRDGPDSCFIPHKRRDDSTLVTTSAIFESEVTELKEAVPLLWPSLATPAKRHYYLAASVEDLPPTLASPVLDFLPLGCVHDERWLGGPMGLWRPEDAELAVCRGLRSNLWLGAAGVSAEAHYDLSHNVFFQVRSPAFLRPSMPFYRSPLPQRLLPGIRPQEVSAAATRGASAARAVPHLARQPPGGTVRAGGGRLLRQRRP